MKDITFEHLSGL